MSEILLVEDTESTRRLKVDALRNAGFGVHAVFNGKAALEALADGSSCPDVIVSDLNQPEFEGYDLAHTLRGQFNFKALTSTEMLSRRFRRRILFIAERYMEGGDFPQVRKNYGKTPLILTSSGLLPAEWPMKIYPPGYKPSQEEFETDNAEVFHYTRALALADRFFVVEPSCENESGFTRISGMDQVINYIRARIADTEKFLELARRRESGEISPINYNIMGLFLLMERGAALTASELENMPLVLDYEEFEQLGALDIILPNGESTTLLPDDYPTGHTLIIFPWDLGD